MGLGDLIDAVTPEDDRPKVVKKSPERYRAERAEKPQKVAPPLDQTKIAINKGGADYYKLYGEQVVSVESLGVLDCRSNGRRYSKPYRDAADDALRKKMEETAKKKEKET